MASNASIGALHVKLGLDTAQFAEELKSAQGSLANIGKFATASLAGLGAAAAGAVAGLGAAVKGAIDTADELSKASQKVGLSVETLSELGYAAKLADVDLDGLVNGLKKLSVSMVGAAEDADGKAAKAFRQLGVSVTDSSGRLRSTDAVFADVAGSFAEMDDGAKKTALAIDLFGKSGADLLPLLNSGKTGLQQMAEEARKLGIVIDEKTARSAEEFNDNLSRLKTTGQGVSIQLAAALAPALASISGAFVEAAKNGEVMKGVGLALSVALRTLASAAVVGGVAFARLGNTIGTAGNVMSRALKGDFAGAVNAAGKGVAKDFELVQSQVASLSRIWSDAAEQVKAKAERNGEGLSAPAARAADKVKAAKSEIQKEVDELRAYLAREQAAFGNANASPELVKWREQMAKASAMLKLGLDAEAAALINLATSATVSTEELQKVAAAQNEVLTTLPAGVDIARDHWGEFRVAIADAAEQFYDMQDAIDQVFWGLNRNDWVGAFGGIIAAVDQLKLAFSRAATEAERINAIAGVASGIGGAVGGKAGSAISGAASGAALGAKLGSVVPGIGTGIGAVVGGLLGGLGGLFGGGGAKKRAKREAAERARLEAERKAAELAAAKRELELRIMELQGKSLEAVTARRADEIAAADASLKPLLEQAHALEDAAKRRELELVLMGLTKGAWAEEAERRKALLATLDEGNRALQAEIFARQDAIAQRDLELELLGLTSGARAAEAERRRDLLATMAPAQAALQAEIFARQDALAQRELELELLALTQGELAAEVERRRDLLATLPPHLAALQAEIFAREDAAEAAAKAAEVAERRGELERELLRLTDEAAAIEADRADTLAELNAQDPSGMLARLQQSIYDVVDATAAAEAAEARLADLRADLDAEQADADREVEDARKALASAAEDEADRLRDVASRMTQLADGLAAVRRELLAADSSLRGMAASATAARRRFEDVFARAQAGDEQALADLPQAIRDMVATGEKTAPNARAVEALRAEGRRAAAIAEAAARARVSEAQQQIAALNAQVAATLGVQAEVKTLQDRFADLTNALFEQQQTMARAAQAMQELKDELAAQPKMTTTFAAPVFPQPPEAFDAAAASAQLAAPPWARFSADIGPSLEEVSSKLDQLIRAGRETVVNTGQAARTLDDATRGGNVFYTLPAT